MRLLSNKYRLLLLLTLILAAGFVATSLASYLASRKAIEHGIADQTLPLTGDNIYSEIQKDMLRPVFISSLMAHDTFVRDWILAGENDSRQIVRYLAEVKKKYGAITSFLISDKTSKYYYAEGTLKSVSPKAERDIWYYRVRNMPGSDYETNVDIDMANRDSMTIFINHRVYDYDGRFIGATGIGLTLATMSHIIDRYQARFHRNIYFVDGKGAIVLAGKSMRDSHSGQGNIRSLLVSAISPARSSTSRPNPRICPTSSSTRKSSSTRAISRNWAGIWWSNKMSAMKSSRCKACSS